MILVHHTRILTISTSYSVIHINNQKSVIIYSRTELKDKRSILKFRSVHGMTYQINNNDSSHHQHQIERTN